MLEKILEKILKNIFGEFKKKEFSKILFEKNFENEKSKKFVLQVCSLLCI
mgnify:CR=1 FL=1